MSALVDELAPLAARMRPRSLAELVGQRHLVGERGLIAQMVARRALPSLILWGPPGCGKTTIAEALADATGHALVRMSAVNAGIKDVRAAVDDARTSRASMAATRTLLFLDEIHRFNKAQQDALLPHVEDGTITLVGATTENPSFEVNSALLSRCRVVVLEPLDDAALEELVARALADRERGLGARALKLDDDARAHLVTAAAGDARKLLVTLEIAADLATAQERTHIALAVVEQACGRRALRYDKAGDAHYDLASALIKSLRGTDPDAAMFYLVRMLEAGEDPRFLIRRLVIFASEDIGNADPHALVVATAALHAIELVGLPEGTLALTQAATYLAMAPKSNTVLTTYAKTREAVLAHPAARVPHHIRNAPTALMKQLGFGAGYQYPHDFAGNYVPTEYLPDDVRGQRFYFPSENGVEARIKTRLDDVLQKRGRRAP